MAHPLSIFERPPRNRTCRRAKDRVCTRCKTKKPSSCFYKDRHRKNGLGFWCKSCSSEYQKINRLINPGKRWSEIKQNAFSRGLPFTLTREQFAEFWKKPCSYCSEPIEHIGLDRIENNLGYVYENVVSCCGQCNSMKGSLPRADFLIKCVKISEVSGGR